MTKEEQGQISRDWRNEANYSNLKRVDRRGFAWEYLRRDPAYRYDRKFDRVEASQTYQGIPIIGTPSILVPSIWGLRFRRGTRLRRAERQNLLG